MKFEVYCDEALPDLPTSRRPRARYLMIGSLWLPAALRSEAKARIIDLRTRHKVWGELKWTKISPSKQAFYEEFIDIFMSFDTDMRFRCIAIDHEQINLALPGNDGEPGHCKFHHQLLHHWIQDFNEYRIFCVLRNNRDKKRLPDLQRCLHDSNPSSAINGIQSLPSSEVLLLQLCDVLLGAASSRLNQTLGSSTAKAAVVRKLEDRLDIADRIGPTPRTEEKFNVCRVRLGEVGNAVAT